MSLSTGALAFAEINVDVQPGGDLQFAGAAGIRRGLFEEERAATGPRLPSDNAALEDEDVPLAVGRLLGDINHIIHEHEPDLEIEYDVPMVDFAEVELAGLSFITKKKPLRKLKFYEYYCAACGDLHNIAVPPKWVNFHCRSCDQTEFVKCHSRVRYDAIPYEPARKTMQQYCMTCGNMQRIFMSKLIRRRPKCNVCGDSNFTRRLRNIPWVASEQSDAQAVRAPSPSLDYD